MREITANILDMRDGVIFQCVNTRGKMGAGLALQTKRRFPAVYEYYRLQCKRWSDMLLGAVRICDSENIAHALLFTQDTIGRTGVHTKMTALNTALERAKTAIRRNEICYFPYGMGCGLGGGDWKEVYALIQHYFPDGILVKLPN